MLTPSRGQRERCCEDNAGHYFDEAMREVYERSSEVYPENRKKTPIHGLRSATFEVGVCTPGNSNPFMKIHDGLEAACKQEEKELIQSLSNDIGGIFQIMEDDLERMRQLQAQQPDLASIEQRAVQMGAVEAARACLTGLRSLLEQSGVVVEGQ